MGWDYSFDLYFEVTDIERALIATETISEDNRQGFTEIVLPDKRTIKVPYTSDFKPASLNIIPNGQYISLDTSLWFPLDEAIRSYIDGMNRDPHFAPRDGVLGAGIGYIYLLIEAGKEYARFSYRAATNHMSSLFLASKSIQDTFLHLLQASNGVVGLINTEDYEFGLLGKPEIKVYIDWEQFQNLDGSIRVDAVAKHILATIDK